MSAGITSLLTLQYFAWFIALVALVIGLYTLVINPRHPANRHVSFLLLLIAAQVFAIGSMINNVGVESSAAILQATLPAMLLVATTLARQPVLLLVIVVLLKPDWLIGSAHEPGSLEANRTRRFSWRWIWWLVYAFIPLIFVLVFLDAVFATNGSWLPQNLQLYLGGSYDLSANYSEALRLFQSSSLGIFLQSLIRFLLQFSLSGFGLIKFVLLVFLLARHYLSRRANHADQSGIPNRSYRYESQTGADHPGCRDFGHFGDHWGQFPIHQQPVIACYLWHHCLHYLCRCVCLRILPADDFRAPHPAR